MTMYNRMQQRWSIDAIDTNTTGRIQIDMRTVCRTEMANFITVNRISIELYFYAIPTLI